MRNPHFIKKLMSHINIAICKKSTMESLSNIIQSEELLKAQQDEIKELQLQIQQQIQQQLQQQIQQQKHQTYIRWSVFDDTRNMSNATVKTLQCPLCGHQNKDTKYVAYKSYCMFQGGDLIRHQCPKCDLIFGDQKMFSLSNEALDNDYNWHYTSYSEGDSTELELRAFHMLNPEPNGIYLNYGAGSWSSSLSKLREEGWNVWAYEPTESATQSFDNEFIITSKAQLATMKFDGIFSNNVLEHIRHPVEELKFLSGLLSKKSLMSHATPCFEYKYEFTRFHLYFYLGKSRELLAEKSGLKIKSFVQDGDFMCAVYSQDNNPENIKEKAQ